MTPILQDNTEKVKCDLYKALIELVKAITEKVKEIDPNKGSN